MKSYRLAVCKGPDCARGGSMKVFSAVKQAVEARGLASRCEVYRGGCYGLCHMGPNVVIREAVPGKKKDPFSREDFELTGEPGECHYAAMQADQAERLVDEHVGKDTPVEAWLGRNRAASGMK